MSLGCLNRYPFGVLSTRSPFFPAAATVHQSYPHHATQLHGHQPQPATTPTGSQPQSQHAAPSPVQVPVMWEWVGRSEWSNQELGGWKRASEELGHSSTEKQYEPMVCLHSRMGGIHTSLLLWQHQAGQAPHLGSGQPQQNLYHPGALTGTPPSLPPGPSAQSPQSSFPQPAAVYAIHPHQQLPHGFTNMAHVTQVRTQRCVPEDDLLEGSLYQYRLCSAALIRNLRTSHQAGH